MDNKTELKLVEIAAEIFADDRKRLAGIITELQNKIDRLKASYQVDLQMAVDNCMRSKAELEEMVKQRPQLFTRPRTMVLHGIKVGFQKSKGSIGYSDEERVIQLIHKHYSEDEAHALLHITEKPDKEALGKLSAQELRKLGVEVNEAGDNVVVKPIEGEVEKQVKTLLLACVEETTEVAA